MAAYTQMSRIPSANVVAAPTAGLTPWREVIQPHGDVRAGTTNVAEFAADLELVRLGEGKDEYRDPRLFFERTYLTKSLLDLAAQQEVFDERLWLAIAAATGAPGNTSALVGTAEQVAAAILRYYDLGIDSFLIRGFRPLEDVREFGRELIPLVRAGAAERDRAARAAD